VSQRQRPPTEPANQNTHINQDAAYPADRQIAAQHATFSTEKHIAGNQQKLSANEPEKQNQPGRKKELAYEETTQGGKRQTRTKTASGPHMRNSHVAREEAAADPQSVPPTRQEEEQQPALPERRRRRRRCEHPTESPSKIQSNPRLTAARREPGEETPHRPPSATKAPPGTVNEVNDNGIPHMKEPTK
jgi:hypothetical protein